MRTATAAFEQAIRGSHRLAVQIDVLARGEVLTSIDTADGTVTLDATAQIRGRADLTLPATLIPTDATSLLAPYGNELQVRRGIEFANGARETISLGVFRIEDVEIADSGSDRSVRVSCSDRSARISDARFEQPYQIAAGTNYATAIHDLIASVASSLTFNFTATALTTPLITALEGDDRWGLAQQMAAAIGMSLYFDGDGVCVLAPVGAGAAVAAIAEGDGGALISAARKWTRAGTYNRVIATGENTGETTPARGVATDENTASPTYYYGPFGQVPRFYSSPLITTDAQALSAAQKILAGELGTTQQVSFGSLVDPRLEPGDVVRITRQASGIDEDHVLDTLTLPLTPDGVMTGTTRQVTS